jgi:hypothetical protein
VVIVSSNVGYKVAHWIQSRLTSKHWDRESLFNWLNFLLELVGFLLDGGSFTCKSILCLLIKIFPHF